MAEVMTVLGPVDDRDLGITLPHEHLLLDLFRVYQPHRELLMNDRELAAAELSRFADHGGGCLVEVTTPDLGRDPLGLAEISQAAGVHVVMGTGRYREPFYEPEIWQRSTAQLAHELISEISSGTADGVRPGIIGELGTDAGHLSPVEERCHRAAARAQLETGLALTTHSLAQPVGLAQIEIFVEEGVHPGRIVIGHCDTVRSPDYRYQLELLDRGAWVQLDTVRGVSEFETARQIRLLTALLAAGYTEQLLLSHDVASEKLLHAQGAHGYTYLLDEFRDRLRATGVSEEQLQLLMVDNPRRMLTGEL